MGHVFKRTVCVWPPGDCPRCLLRHNCSYSYVFETPVPPQSAKLRNWNQIPRPFVIEPPLRETGRGSIQPGETFAFDLLLIGRAIDFLPYFVFTFQELGRAGLGAGRGKFDVAEVHSKGLGDPELIYTSRDGTLRPHGGSITASDLVGDHLSAEMAKHDLMVRFLTPTRIRTEGTIRHEVTFADFARALLRRLSSLCYFHCGCELDADFQGLIERAAAIRTVDSDLRWQHQERFSSRQKQDIYMGGIVGTIRFAAPDPAAWHPYLPLLSAGQWVHVGKGTVMGLGKYDCDFGHCPPQDNSKREQSQSGNEPVEAAK
jgi:hypothetical protein